MHQGEQQHILDQVRRIMPLSTLDVLARALTRFEARIVAERQAMRLLRLLGITGPSVEIELVLELPDIALDVREAMPLSGHSEWDADRQQWIITINRDDSLWRSRATLAHELKHILDDPFRGLLYPDWPRDVVMAPPEDAEAICDYFAGCVLVPKAWLTRAWVEETHEITELASLFDVSERLVRVRLKQVGLVLGHSAAGSGEGMARYMRHRNARLPAGLETALQAVGPGIVNRS
jgi:Zn-dependent peptidase ImmA (M78 family)